MRVDSCLKGYKPLFYNNSGNLVLSKGNKIFERRSTNLELICKLPFSRFANILFKVKLLSRLFRYGVRSAVEYDGAYYFTFNRAIYRFELSCAKLTNDFIFIKGRGPLSFTVIENIKGFQRGLYFGEYIANRHKYPVKIYHRQHTWSVVYTFGEGELNHIHGLVTDRASDCLWVLAGDFKESAAIFRAQNNFNNVEPVVRGRQKYRACVAFPVETGLLYATDTQQEKNSIRLLTNNYGVWESEKICDINGPCIYGQELPDYYVFSTSTEPSEIVTSRFLSLLDNKPAPAIEKNQSDMILLSKNGGDARIGFSAAKDIFPFRLFQFGTIMFPHGISKHNEIAAYFVGSKKNDLALVFFSLENEF